MRVLLCLLGLAMAVPAYAGHGTIEETEECFIVEWSGDASDKVPEKKQNNQGTVGVAATGVSGGAEAKKDTSGAAGADDPTAARRNRRPRRGAALSEETGSTPNGRQE